MNNIEQHVTSKDLGMRLEELGVPQNSNFYWLQPNPIVGDMKDPFLSGDLSPLAFGATKICSAFLASELGEMLGRWKSTIVYDELHGWRMFLDVGQITDSDEPNFRAKLLIYLIEQGYLDVKELSTNPVETSN